MKTNFFKTLFVLLISLPFGEGWGGVLLSAQNGVTVSGLAVNAGTVTFNVSWKNTGMPAVWSDTVWVFVDYNVSGKMERLPLAPGATLTTHTAPAGEGKVMEVSGNNTGVWVVGNARSAGSFSATVQLLTATAAADFSGACVYGSNCPPVGRYTAVSELSFTGTLPYDIVLKNNGGVTTTVSINSSTYTVPAGYTVQSFSDKTGAPGKFNCTSPATYTLSGSDVCLNSTVSLTLSGSQSGWQYQLYKGSTAIGSIVNGTGSALTFSEAATATGTFNYTVQTIDATGVQCEMPVSNTRGITVNGVPGVPTMSGGGSQCGGTRSITASAGSGGAGIRWTDNSSTAATRDVGTGTYYAVTTSAAGCESAQASVAVTINAVPANPTVTAASRCGTGTVALRASSSGAVIDWYSASSGGTSLTTSNTYTTSSLTATATYYAQARSTSAGSCTSAARTAVTATVNTVPSVTLSSGSNNQSVNAGTAIGTIKYTASNATTIYRSGTLPTNVSSSVTSNTTLSIYGTPSVTGTFTYSVSSSHTNGCVSSTTLAGTITVNAASSFSSSTTWSYGGLTWSDRVVGPSACNKSNFSNDYTALNCRSYTGSDGVLRYYYNWPYVNANKSTMCPSPWRVPTQSDFNTLVSNTDATTLINIWGYGGLASLTSILYSDTNSRYWSSMELDRTTAYCLYYDSNKVNVSSSGRDYGEQVRCVK